MENGKWEMENGEPKQFMLLILHFQFSILNCALRLHRRQEFGVCLGLRETLDDDLHLLDRRQRV